MIESCGFPGASFEYVIDVESDDTVDPRLSSYNRTRPWPDKWNSQLCESSCKRHNISTAVSFPFMLSIVGTNNCRILASSDFEWSKFRHLWVFKRSSTSYFAPCGAWALNRMHSDWDRIIRVVPGTVTMQKINNSKCECPKNFRVLLIIEPKCPVWTGEFYSTSFIVLYCDCCLLCASVRTHEDTHHLSKWRSRVNTATVVVNCLDRKNDLGMFQRQ